ncbi:MAG: alpha/beta hydrolase [Actinomycetota bacterium]|nr:alpha/beta hydrolase [Actinomycetota bacterium]
MDNLEREYSPSSRAGGSAEPFVADYQARSVEARVQLGVVVRPLGSEGVSGLVVPAAEGAPLLVFVHGGYWQALSAGESLFLAPPLARLGWSYAALEYTLAPDAGIEQMVAECTAGLAALAALGARRVVLAGHSAGAHLAAMASLVQAAPLAIDRLVLVSGVYDLRPLVHTTVNEPLDLDERSAAGLSPLLLPIRSRPGTVADIVVAWGDNDTDAFRAQGLAYAERIGARPLECSGRHHFDIVDDLADPTTALGALTLA